MARGRFLRRGLAGGNGDTDTTFEDLEEEAEEEADETAETSLADLVGGADPNTFDQTFNVTKELHPVATTETPAIPKPWQGIPRVALVYNFNYVYDETAQEWVRQNPFSGGGGAAGQDAFHTTVDGTDNLTIGPGSAGTVPIQDSSDMEFNRQFDSGDNLDASNDEFVAPTDAAYRFEFGVAFVNFPTGTLIEGFLSLFSSNGGVIADFASSATIADNDNPQVNAGAVIDMNEGEKVRLRADQESGANQDLSDLDIQVYLSGFRVLDR